MGTSMFCPAILRITGGLVSRSYFCWPSLVKVPTTRNMSQFPTVEISPPAALKGPINVPKKLLLGAGPATSSDRVLAAGALPLLGILHAESFQVMDEIKAGLQYVFQTKNELTLAISGTGHAGMEAAAVNILEPGDVILVCKKGIWGERMAEMAERMGADVRIADKTPGDAFTLAEIEEALKKHRPCVMFITQGESSTGVGQPVEGMGDLCHKYDCLLIVDTVASLGAMPLFTDKWGIDICYSGTQKVLNAPPSLAPITFSERAREKIANRKTKVGSFYFDMGFLGNYWGCDGGPRKYHHTGPISSYYQFREALAEMADEGLENSWKKHENIIAQFHDGLRKLGCELFVKNKEYRLPTITSIVLPSDVHWKDVTTYVMQKHKIEFAGGLGPTAGQIIRIGFMGSNACPEVLATGLAALEDAIKNARSQNAAKM
ncbi:Serine--pyruvate aminotransferase, mitochondrial [Holothuria leucospilota]|uniref:Alanine--glyoxylate aminotransferase n=1 Tax=Holothuria leucospilota TaxID=206669 RepID=A0A9Q0YGX4_HOLLE|nr:Serine--pyruvate aminotransferase, mitochondrial [Holothuria leucospilota]